MKAGTQNHLKVKRLMRLLNAPMYRVVGILETLWLLCQDCCDEGNVGKYSDEEIADYLGWDGPQSPSELVRALSDSGWTDPDEDHRLVVHDWLEHCPEYIRDRVRKRAARGSKPRKQKTYISSTPDKVGQAPDTTENVRKCPSIPNPTQPNPTNPNPTNTYSPAGEAVCVEPSNAPDLSTSGKPDSKPAYSASFERWYTLFPKKTQKQAAATAFGRAVKRIAASRSLSGGDALNWLCDVTTTFRDSPKGRSEYVKNPATWLNEGCYEDDPKEWQRNGSTQRKLDIGPGQRYDDGAQDGKL